MTAPLPTRLVFGQCKDCHWWEMEQSDPKQPHWHRCRRTESHLGRPVRGTIAVALDSVNMDAALFTAPEFGCVLFKEEE